MQLLEIKLPSPHTDSLSNWDLENSEYNSALFRVQLKQFFFVMFCKPFQNNVWIVAGHITYLKEATAIGEIPLTWRGVPGLQLCFCRWHMSNWHPHECQDLWFPSRTCLCTYPPCNVKENETHQIRPPFSITPKSSCRDFQWYKGFSLDILTALWLWSPICSRVCCAICWDT